MTKPITPSDLRVWINATKMWAAVGATPNRIDLDVEQVEEILTRWTTAERVTEAAWQIQYGGSRGAEVETGEEQELIDALSVSCRPARLVLGPTQGVAT